MDTHLTATDLQSASNTVITVSVNQITAKELGMGLQPCSLTTRKAEARGPLGQPGLHSQNLISTNENKNKKAG